MCHAEQDLTVRGLSVGSSMGQIAEWTFEDVAGGRTQHLHLNGVDPCLLVNLAFKIEKSKYA